MGKGLKKAVLVTGALATYSVFKAAREFIKYKKLKNRDVYINSEMYDIEEKKPVTKEGNNS